MYICGDQLFEDELDEEELVKLKETFLVKEARSCANWVERDFFNSGGVRGRTEFEYICSICGAPPEDSPLVADAVLGMRDGKKLLATAVLGAAKTATPRRSSRWRTVRPTSPMFRRPSASARRSRGRAWPNDPHAGAGAGTGAGAGAGAGARPAACAGLFGGGLGGGRRCTHATPTRCLTQWQ